VDIQTSHICNLLSLELIAEYYSVEASLLKQYYTELYDDTVFINALNRKIEDCQPFYSEGLFSRKDIDTVDWFGNQRISLYVLIRLLKPELCVETGVFYGGTTAFILNAISKNKTGRLISIDLPGNNEEQMNYARHSNVGCSEIIPDGLRTGFIVPDYLKDSWELKLDDSREVIPQLVEPVGFFSHDSEHSHDFILSELNLVKAKLSQNATIFADDVNWSNGFLEFCVKEKLYPLFLTDNGKGSLKMRLGMTWMNHPNNGKQEVTGSSTK